MPTAEGRNPAPEPDTDPATDADDAGVAADAADAAGAAGVISVAAAVTPAWTPPAAAPGRWVPDPAGPAAAELDADVELEVEVEVEVVAVWCSSAVAAWGPAPEDAGVPDDSGR
jgi:hypothetical protein